MTINLSTQVAKAKCRTCDGVTRVPNDYIVDSSPTEEPCPSCGIDSTGNPTGLRWSTLSRECPGPPCAWWDSRGRQWEGCYTLVRATSAFQHYPDAMIDEVELPCRCNGSGRVPDVTLEKVLALIWGIRRWKTDRWVAWNGDEEPDGMIDYYGDTPVEAALAALLATLKEE